jgi:hypothetical protein
VKTNKTDISTVRAKYRNESMVVFISEDFRVVPG